MSPGNIDDVESLRAAIALGARPSFLFFWGHSAKTPNVNKHVLSQWWPAKFVLNGGREGARPGGAWLRRRAVGRMLSIRSSHFPLLIAGITGLSNWHIQGT